jgi:hypothetical protein
MLADTFSRKLPSRGSSVKFGEKRGLLLIGVSEAERSFARLMLYPTNTFGFIELQLTQRCPSQLDIQVEEREREEKKFLSVYWPHS